MNSFATHARKIVNVAVLGALGSTMLALPSQSMAASKTLTISGTPAASVTVSGSYSFQPTAKDTVKSRIKFDIYNKPSWAEFNNTTGLLSGRPNRRQVGTYGNITIRLTDWYGYVTTPAFSITVLAATASTPPTQANRAPSITGTAAAAVNVNTAYSFTPKATDPDGNKLEFFVQGLPAWAQFNSASGTVSGTPSAADVGTYANISIRVSDGQSNAVLPSFTIAVNQMSAGNATLDWTAPTENADGSALTNLAGYNVHYGTSKDSMTQTVKVPNPGLTSYVVENLSSGTWYFAVTSYTTEGRESLASGVISSKIL